MHNIIAAFPIDMYLYTPTTFTTVFKVEINEKVNIIDITTNN